jgi:hypothetical protein
MISRYNTFLGERLFESTVNESMIYYTKEFKDALYKLSLKNKIAKELIDVEYTDVKPDMTFIGMSDKEGYFSFTQIKKAVKSIKDTIEKLAKETGLDQDSDSIKTLKNIYKKIEDGTTSQSDVNHLYNNDPWNLKDKARSDAKIAKLVNQIFPDKYSNKEVEEFTNLFKKIGDTDAEFVLVEGNEIKHWYNEKQYEFETGELGNSCMRYPRCGQYLNIYSENPEVCRLLILKSEDGEEIKGRVLIWKIKEIDIENVEYYMDRIYAIDDATKLMFQQYADKQGWLKRLTSRYGDSKDFKLGDVEYLDVKATVQLKSSDFDQYPYMDTFKRLLRSKNLLINDDDEDYEGCYIMTHTDGTYDDTSGKWSDYFDCKIPESEAIYSEPLRDWIYREDAMHVEYGSRRGWYPDEYSSIIKDCITGNWIHEDDSVYSEWYDDNFLEDDQMSCITWIDDDSDLQDCRTSAETLSDQDKNMVSLDSMECGEYLKKFEHDSDYIAGDVLSKGENGKYYFNDHGVKVFKTEKGNFISEDCQALGLKTNEKSFYWTDRFAYNYKMDAMTKQTILKALKEKINQIENMEGVLGSGRQKRLVFNEPDNKDFLNDEDYIKANRYLLQSLKRRLNSLQNWI